MLRARRHFFFKGLISRLPNYLLGEGHKPFIRGVEKKEKIKQNAYIWAFSTGKSFHEATYYQVSDRSADTVKEFYCGKKVKLMCDGYAAYYGLSNITPVSCMVHIRRKFANILKANKGERNSESNTSQIINMFAKIYNVENTIKSEESDFEKVKERRLTIKNQ